MHSRHTERSEVSRVSCVALAANSRLGFTLPEVCVALAVFLIGTTALLGGWNFFNREIADERYRVERFYGVVSSMELLITERPLCADSRVMLDAVSVRLTRVPGNNYLAWAVVERDGFRFKRLVRCK